MNHGNWGQNWSRRGGGGNAGSMVHCITEEVVTKRAGGGGEGGGKKKKQTIYMYIIEEKENRRQRKANHLYHIYNWPALLVLFLYWASTKLNIYLFIIFTSHHLANVQYHLSTIIYFFLLFPQFFCRYTYIYISVLSLKSHTFLKRGGSPARHRVISFDLPTSPGHLPPPTPHSFI